MHVGGHEDRTIAWILCRPVSGRLCAGQCYSICRAAPTVDQESIKCSPDLHKFFMNNTWIQ